jgi:hypothetical protein
MYGPKAVHGQCGNCGAITTGKVPGYMPTLSELATKFPCCVTGNAWRLIKLIYRKCVWHDGGKLIVKRPLAWTIKDVLLSCGLRRHELAELTFGHLQQREGH